MKKLLALAFVCSALSVQAGIGETKQQVEARYGKPLKTETDKLIGGIGDSQLTYKWNDYFVWVTYVGGLSEHEVISREDDKRILIPEIEELLKVHGGGFKRVKDSVLSDPTLKDEVKVWETPNGDQAWYQRSRVTSKRSEYMLFITSRKYRDLEAAQKKGSKAK